MLYNEENKRIVTGDFQNPPKQFSFTIANGAIETIEYAHQFFRILSLSNSSGVTLRFGKTGLETDVIGAGLGYELDVPCTASQIINRSGGAITITVVVSMARIYDDRLNVSGNIQVVNAAGTELAVDISGSTASFGQQVVTGAADQIVASLATRKNIIMTNHGPADCYIGDTNAVLTTTGILMASGASLSLDYSGDVWAICATSTTVGWFATEV